MNFKHLFSIISLLTTYVFAMDEFRTFVNFNTKFPGAISLVKQFTSKNLDKIEFSPSGNYLVGCGYNKKNIYLFDLNLNETFAYETDDKFEFLFSPCEKYLIVTTPTTVFVHDLKNLDNLSMIIQTSCGSKLSACSVSEDDKYLLIPRDKFIDIYDMQKQTRVSEITSTHIIDQAKFSNDSNYIVYISQHFIDIFDFNSGNNLSTCFKPEKLKNFLDLPITSFYYDKRVNGFMLQNKKIKIGYLNGCFNYKMNCKKENDSNLYIKFNPKKIDEDWNYIMPLNDKDSLFELTSVSFDPRLLIILGEEHFQNKNITYFTWRALKFWERLSTKVNTQGSHPLRYIGALAFGKDMKVAFYHPRKLAVYLSQTVRIYDLNYDFIKIKSN